MAIIRLFASIREKIGMEQLEIRLTAPCTLRLALLQASEAQGIDPAVLTGASLLYAVNQRMTDLDSTVEEKDEIAVLPPMSGG
ncbi:MAG: MoaD/ThiS family protein [Nitrospinota bacterium]|nr:MoaD/ThiS family protein [Nitrospinota bacterium]